LASLWLWLSASTRRGWPELPQLSFAAAQGHLAVLVCQEVVENVESGRAGGFWQWSGGHRLIEKNMYNVHDVLYSIHVTVTAHANWLAMLQTWSKSVVVSRFDPRTSHSQNDALKEDLLALPTNRLWSPGQQGCLANVRFMVTMFLKFVSTHIHPLVLIQNWTCKKKVAKSTTPCLTPPSRVSRAPAVVAAWKQDVSGVESKLFQGWTNRTKYQDDSNDYVMILLRVLICADCSYVFRNRTPMLWLSSVSDNSPPSSHPMNSKTCAWWQTFPNKTQHSMGIDQRFAMIPQVFDVYARACMSRTVPSGNHTIRHITLNHQKACPPSICPPLFWL
jgi:hypothetical protein